MKAVRVKAARLVAAKKFEIPTVEFITLHLPTVVFTCPYQFARVFSLISLTRITLLDSYIPNIEYRIQDSKLLTLLELLEHELRKTGLLICTTSIGHEIE